MSEKANRDDGKANDRCAGLLKTLNLLVDENDADELVRDDWSEYSDLCDAELEQLKDIQEKDPALNESELIRKKEAAISFLRDNFSIYMDEP